MNRFNRYQLKPLGKSVHHRQIIGKVNYHGFHTFVDVYSTLAGEEMHEVSGKVLVIKFKGSEETRETIVHGGYTSDGRRVAFCHQKTVAPEDMEYWLNLTCETEEEREGERKRIEEFRKNPETYATLIDANGYEYIRIEDTTL